MKHAKFTAIDSIGRIYVITGSARTAPPASADAQAWVGEWALWTAQGRQVIHIDKGIYELDGVKLTSDDPEAV